MAQHTLERVLRLEPLPSVFDQVFGGQFDIFLKRQKLPSNNTYAKEMNEVITGGSKVKLEPRKLSFY